MLYAKPPGAITTVLCLCLWLPFATQAADTLSIENAQLRVTLSTQSAGVFSVLRKENGSTWTNATDLPQVLRLRIPLDYWEGHLASGGQAERIKVVNHASDSVVFRIEKLNTQEGRFPLRAEIHYRLVDDNLVAQLALENRGDFRVDEVTFPVLESPPATAADEKIVSARGPIPLRYLFSQNTLRTHHNPFERLDPSDFRGWIHADPAISAKAIPYPSADSRLHTAWMSYEADGLSIGWDVRDQSFQTQHAMIERKLQRDRISAADNRQSYELSWRWYPVIEPGASWQSPEVWLKFSAADWHPVARQHREWLETWVRRPDPPEAFRSSIGWISRGVTSYDDIPRIAKSGVAVGAPYFFVYGWYGYGMNHLSYGYFPRAMLGGEASLRRNLKEARALGAYPLAWYNPTTTVESTPEHQAFGKDWALVNRNGGLVVDGRWSLFDPDRPPTTDDSTVDMNFDMGTGAADYTLEAVRRMIADYGFSGLELDQTGKNFLSWSAHTTHPPALSYSSGMRTVFEETLRIVREHDPNGIIVGEGMTDFMNQYVDSSWIFEGGESVFANAESMAAASDYLRYSMPWTTYPTRARGDDPGHANAAFMLNLPLDIFIDLDRYPDYAAHLKKLHALKQKIHPHLYRGRFSGTEGFNLASSDSASVIARSYQEASGWTVVVINTSAKTQTAEVAFIESADGGVTRAYALGGMEQTLPSVSPAIVTLAPHDIIALVMQRGGAGK